MEKICPCHPNKYALPLLILTLVFPGAGMIGTALFKPDGFDIQLGIIGWLIFVAF